MLIRFLATVGGILATVLLRRRMWAWLVPVLGLVLVLVGFFVASTMVDAAMLKRP